MKKSKAKCPICGKEMCWLDDIESKKRKQRYLVWCCNVNDDAHWQGGHIFVSDLNFNTFSIEEGDRIRDEIRDEEIEEMEWGEF